MNTTAQDGEALAAFACQQVVARMSSAFDAGNYQAGLAHYAPDAVWHRPDGVLSGIDQIAGYYGNRSPSLVICHVLTNFVVDFDAEGIATCSYYSMGFLQKSDEKRTLPVAMPGVGVLWRYHDRLARTEAGWKVIERRADRIYEPMG